MRGHGVHFLQHRVIDYVSVSIRLAMVLNFSTVLTFVYFKTLVSFEARFVKSETQYFFQRSWLVNSMNISLPAVPNTDVRSDLPVVWFPIEDRFIT